MDKTASMVLQDQTFLIKGDLQFSNVMQVNALVKPHLEALPELCFDFSAVQSSDSSGLALILEWVKYAKINNKPIKLKHLSDKLLSLSKIAGLSGMIC